MELPHDSAVPLLGVYLRDENTGLLQHLSTSVQSSTIYNSQTVQTTQMPIGEKMDVENVVCPSDGPSDISV